MLAIEVVLLTGRFVATAHDDREAGEWPPHPARLFSALVAEWGSAENPSRDEMAVLERLECLDPPAIRVGPAVPRSAVTHYVPVNDATVIGNRLWDRVRQVEDAAAILRDPLASDRARASAQRQLAKSLDVSALVAPPARPSASPLPQDRARQPRVYPSVTPHDPVVTYVWSDSNLTSDERATLDGLLERVTRLGHSSSLVSCRLVAEPVEPTLVPSVDGPLALRGVSPGQVQALIEEFGRHRASRPRSLPATTVRYAPAGGSASRPVHRADTSGDWFILQFDRDRLPSWRTAEIAHAARGALLAHAGDTIEIVHGHDAEGKPTRRAHVSMLPLPDVGHPHASGSILGVAVMLPRLLSPSERRVVLAAIGRWLEASGALTLPGGRRIRVRHVPDPILHTLRRVTWARPSVSWVSATPIALPWRARRAKNQADEWELAQEWVMAACGHVGLPAPEQVQVGLAPLLHGALPAGRYPAFRQGPTARRLVHARVRFAEPVEGPLVLGSGRFQGLGLMRPLPTGGSR